MSHKPLYVPASESQRKSGAAYERYDGVLVRRDGHLLSHGELVKATPPTPTAEKDNKEGDL